MIINYKLKKEIEMIKDEIDTSRYQNILYYLSFFNNNINIDFKTNLSKSITFLNSTYEDYHHGCSATSFVIESKIKECYLEFDTISIQEIRDIKENLIQLDKFDDLNYYQYFTNKYKNIFNIIKKNESVVVNGEGCISY